MVATAAGTMKNASAMADHCTGKTEEAMRARMKAHAPQLVHSNQRRRFISRAIISRAGQRAGSTGTKGATFSKGYTN